MSSPLERTKEMIASRFFAGDSVAALCLDYDETRDFVFDAIRSHRLYEEEQAVIEAARECLIELQKEVDDEHGGWCYSADFCLDRLRLVIEALDKAEEE